MSARLPIPGSDDGDWGNILNTFLEVSLNSDGTLNTDAVGTALSSQLPSPIPTDNLGSGTPSSSNFLRGDGTWAVPSGGGSVTSVFGRSGAVVAQSNDYTAADVTNAADKSSGTTQTFTGDLSAPAFIAAGLTGATTASRYVGGVTGNQPVSGTFSTGDYVIDSTGAIRVCTAGGSPGTWASIAQLNSNSSNIHSLGATAAAGSSGVAADAGHVHPTTGLALLAGATFTGSVNPAVSTLTYGSTITADAENGNDFRVTLTGSGATIAPPTGPTDGQRVTFQITQDSTGSRTVTWSSAAGGFNFGTSGTPTLSTAPNLTDVIGFIYNASIGQWLAAGAALGF